MDSVRGLKITKAVCPMVIASFFTHVLNQQDNDSLWAQRGKPGTQVATVI
jgi:hypothetical protein